MLLQEPTKTVQTHIILMVRLDLRIKLEIPHIWMNEWVLALVLIIIGEQKLQGCNQRQEPKVKIVCVAIFKKVHTLKINQ